MQPKKILREPMVEGETLLQAIARISCKAGNEGYYGYCVLCPLCNGAITEKGCSCPICPITS